LEVDIQFCYFAEGPAFRKQQDQKDKTPALADTEIGKLFTLLKTSSAVRTCGFDFGGDITMFSTDNQMGYQCFVRFFDLQDPSQTENNEPYVKISCSDSKITSAV